MAKSKEEATELLILSTPILISSRRKILDRLKPVQDDMKNRSSSCEQEELRETIVRGS